MEFWKDIPDYEGLYQVSNYGRIKSLDRNIDVMSGNQFANNINVFELKVSEKILNQNILNKGYSRITLSKSGIRRTFLVHRLVAILFIPKRDDQKFIIHIDHTKVNNNVLNLQWANQDEKNSHHQEYYKKSGPRWSKISETKVRIIKRMLNDPTKKTRIKMIARQFGVSEMQIYRIKSGENWGYVKI